MDEDPINESEKIRIVSDFILHAPPGEFNEVERQIRRQTKGDKERDQLTNRETQTDT